MSAAARCSTCRVEVVLGRSRNCPWCDTHVPLPKVAPTISYSLQRALEVTLLAHLATSKEAS